MLQIVSVQKLDVNPQEYGRNGCRKCNDYCDDLVQIIGWLLRGKQDKEGNERSWKKVNQYQTKRKRTHRWVQREVAKKASIRPTKQDAKTEKDENKSDDQRNLKNMLHSKWGKELVDAF